MWSVVEKTALAEAEVEYHDHTCTTIGVRFPIVTPSRAGAGRRIASSIWTTTPWTIPANRAVAYGEEIEYALIARHRGQPKAAMRMSASSWSSPRR